MGTNGTVFGNHTVAYTIPTNLNASGSYNIVAAVPYVVGVSLLPLIACLKGKC